MRSKTRDATRYIHRDMHMEKLNHLNWIWVSACTPIFETRTKCAWFLEKMRWKISCEIKQKKVNKNASIVLNFVEAVNFSSLKKRERSKRRQTHMHNWNTTCLYVCVNNATIQGNIFFLLGLFVCCVNRVPRRFDKYLIISFFAFHLIFFCVCTLFVCLSVVYYM